MPHALSSTLAHSSRLRRSACAVLPALSSTSGVLVGPCGVRLCRSSSSSSSHTTTAAGTADRPAVAEAMGPAAAGPGSSGGGGAQVCVDVTRENFQAMLPVVKAALDSCAFFAFDCEMTGLFLDGNQHDYLDDIQERYAKVRASALAFQVAQVGLSCFTAAGPGTWSASTFNFWVFPRPGRNSNRRFLCEAASMAFLANQGFDFNTWLQRGIPYLPVVTRDTLLTRVARSGAPFPSGPPVVAKTEADRQLVGQVLAQVEAWLAAGDAHAQQQQEQQQQQEEEKEEAASLQGAQLPTAAGSCPPAAAIGEGATDRQSPLPAPPPPPPPGAAQHRELLLPSMNAYHRLLVYNSLRNPPWAARRGGHPGVWVVKAEEGRFAPLRVVRTADAAEAAALEASEAVRRVAEVKEAAGFAEVMAMLRDSGKPAVGHNAMFDLAYMLASFASPDLPEDWTDYKRMVQRWFPGGVYDTKFIAQQAAQVWPSTALGDLYQQLFYGGDEAICCIQHAAGLSKYAGLPPGAAAHEAGYDAFMTGSCFAALEHLAVRAGEQPDGSAAAAAAAATASVQCPTQGWAQQLLGRLPVGRSDIEYASLWADDPIPERPGVFFVAGLPQSNSTQANSNLLSSALSVTQVSVTPLRTRGGVLMEVDSATAHSLGGLAAAAEDRSVKLPCTTAWDTHVLAITPWGVWAQAQRAAKQTSKRPADGSIDSDRQTQRPRVLASSELASETPSWWKGVCAVM